jgi:predicted DNA-binding transcriptional regulator AlpA
MSPFHLIARIAMHNESEFISAAQVKQRYGSVSDMWLTRRIKDSDFPPPVYFGGRNRFWKVAELEKWERRVATRGPQGARPKPPERKRRAA